MNEMEFLKARKKIETTRKDKEKKIIYRYFASFFSLGRKRKKEFTSSGIDPALLYFSRSRNKCLVETERKSARVIAI